MGDAGSSWASDSAATRVTARPAACLFAGAPVQVATLADRTIFGTPEEAVERVRAYVAAGCRKFILFPIAPGGEIVHQVRLIATRVLPRVA